MDLREHVYEVFARKARGDRLFHIGWVDAFDDETARIHAWTTYSEEKWFEMVVVRRDKLVAVNRWGAGFDSGAGSGSDTRSGSAR